MRITPIMAYTGQNCRPKNQNVRFGQFENEETKQYVKENFLSDENLEPLASQLLEYMDKTPFFTVKMAKGLDGKPFVYAVMNKEETDRHEHKDKFDNMRKWHYSPHDVEVKIQSHKKEAEIIKSEPEFLTGIKDYRDADILCRNFIKAEKGYEPPKTTPSKSESSSDERDNFYEALKLNGGGF